MKPMLAGLTLIAALGAPAVARGQEKGTGPVNIFIQYQCKPERRVAFREYMTGMGLRQLEAWKAQGTFKNYLALFSTGVNMSFDMFVRLQFEKYVDTARWYEIEKTLPGGLPADGLALSAPTSTIVADLTWSGGGEKSDPSRSMYLVIPYEYTARALYKTYAEGYVLPQVREWLKEGVLSSYNIHLNNHEAGATWDALFLLEYRDIEGLALRRVTTSLVREGLGKDPAWKTLADIKADIRTEGEVVIAAPLLPR